MGPRIGTFLRARGWLTAEELSQALDYQSSHECKLGKCLIELGFLSERRILTALSEQLKVPFIFEPITNAGRTALTSVPKYLCTQFHIIPFEYRQNHILRIVVDIDLNEEVILAVREVLGCSVQPYLTTRDTMTELLERFVSPLPEETRSVLSPVNLNPEEMGSIFLEGWSRCRASKARFAAFDQVIWLRYLSLEGFNDHLLIPAEKRVLTNSCVLSPFTTGAKLTSSQLTSTDILSK